MKKSLIFEKRQIESNQLYITDEQEKKQEKISISVTERRKEREREIRIGLKILSFSFILDQIHFLMYSTKHSHSIIDTIVYIIIRSL